MVTPRGGGGGGAVRVPAVDIAGVFDKVSHCGALHKLKSYGIFRGTVPPLCNFEMKLERSMCLSVSPQLAKLTLCLTGVDALMPQSSSILISVSLICLELFFPQVPSFAPVSYPYALLLTGHCYDSLRNSLERSQRTPMVFQLKFFDCLPSLPRKRWTLASHNLQEYEWSAYKFLRHSLSLSLSAEQPANRGGLLRCHSS